MFGKRKVAAVVAEFLGTGVLTLLVLSVQRSTLGLPFFVAFGAGLAVALMVFTFGNVSGAILNPALTLALWTTRKISAFTGLVYIVVQFLGAWGTYYLYTYYVNTKLQPIGGHATFRIFLAEAIGTAVFVFGWSAASYRRFTPQLSAAVAGLAFMVGIIAASPASIGLLNPALALGVRSWVWATYILGPVVGALLAANVYAYLFADETEVLATAEAAVVAASATPKVTPKVTTKAVKTPAKATRATKKTVTKAAPKKKTTTRAKK